MGLDEVVDNLKFLSPRTSCVDIIFLSRSSRLHQGVKGRAL